MNRPKPKAQPTPKVPAGSSLHSRPRQARLIPRAPPLPLRPKTNPHPAFLSHSRTRPGQCKQKALPSRPLGHPDSPRPLRLPIGTGSRRHCLPSKRPRECRMVRRPSMARLLSQNEAGPSTEGPPSAAPNHNPFFHGFTASSPSAQQGHGRRTRRTIPHSNPPDDLARHRPGQSPRRCSSPAPGQALGS